uniref:Tectonic-1-3 domain-containing protein n=2 Tax=Salarias fasciatus TaxID=181472 RepID=A0A672F803_SALFA
MLTAGQSGQTGVFLLPAPGLTAHCVDSSPAAFLKDQSSVCSRRLVLDQDCGSLPALSMDAYTSIRLLAGKNQEAAVVPLEVSSVVLRSTDNTETELKLSAGQTVRPSLTEPTLCANVVLKVVYEIRFGPAGELLKASLSLVLGFVREAALPLQQDFQVSYLQEDAGEAVVRHSGNPGYVVGMPLVSGTKTAEGISRSLDPADWLSVPLSSEDQDCLRPSPRRSPLLFGLDSASGCTLRLEDAANCSLVSRLLLDVLRGPRRPPFVASFGNSAVENPLDWVPIKSSFLLEDTPSCSIPVSLHLEIRWTKYGSLVNPQAQIVSVTEVVQTNSSSLLQAPGGGSLQPISSSVSFIPVSAAAQPGYRATPTIDAKLPFDFFLPFV